MIKLKLLGCNGGIGGIRRTTCYALDESVLIDAGTGLTSLSLEEMARIDHVVLTHAHFDHIASLPLLMDSVIGMRTGPINVWGPQRVIEIVANHIFNNLIWTDFTSIPSIAHPFAKLHAIPENQTFDIGGFKLSTLAANHGIPACGYRIEKAGAVLAFSGDTTDCPDFWEAIHNDDELAGVIVECSYSRKMHEMALMSMHMDVDMVIKEFSQLRSNVAGIIVHRKPGLEDEIESELRTALPDRDVRFPISGQEYLFQTK